MKKTVQVERYLLSQNVEPSSWTVFDSETLDVFDVVSEHAVTDSAAARNWIVENLLLNSAQLETPARALDNRLSTIPSAAREFELPRTQSLTINIAQVCNLGCSYCAAGGDGTYGSAVKTPDMDLLFQQIRTALDLTQEDRTHERDFTITFLGGEPLLYPHLIESAVQYAKLIVAGTRLHLNFAVVTNATLISSRTLKVLTAHRFHVTVSLDGPAELNQLARKTKAGRDSTGLVLTGIEALARHRSELSSLKVGAVLGEHHCDPVRTWTFLSELPFDRIQFDFAAHANDQDLSAQYANGLCDVADLAFEKGGEQELRRIAVFDHVFATLDSQAPVTNHCLAGQGHLQLDTQGNWTTCQWFVGSSAENVGSGTHPDPEKLAKWSGSLVQKHGCQSCWARNLCGGGCQFVNKVKTKNKNIRDIVFCDRTRTLFEKGIELYAKARRNHGMEQQTHSAS